MQAEISPERELLDGAVKSYLERLSSLQRECRTLVAGDRGRRYPAQRSATSKDCAAAPTGPITGRREVLLQPGREALHRQRLRGLGFLQPPVELLAFAVANDPREPLGETLGVGHGWVGGAQPFEVRRLLLGELLLTAHRAHRRLGAARAVCGPSGGTTSLSTHHSSLACPWPRDPARSKLRSAGSAAASPASRTTG